MEFLMKLFLSFLCFFAASVSGAAQPNLFNCKSANGQTRVRYTSTSVTGQPTLTVFKNGKEVGAEANVSSHLRADQTAFGMLAALSVVHDLRADAPAEVYGLMIPGIELGNHGKANFKTLMFEGNNGGYRALPAVYQDISQVTALDCTAAQVLF